MDEMTIFDAMSDVAFRKNHHTLPAGHTVNGYMLQRWLSMYSPQVSLLINETSNRQWVSFVDPQHWYDYMFAVIPKLPYKRLKYIKKEPRDKGKNSDHVQLLADMLQISQREAADYIKQCPQLVDELDEQGKDGVFKKSKVAK